MNGASASEIEGLPAHISLAQLSYTLQMTAPLEKGAAPAAAAPAVGAAPPAEAPPAAGAAAAHAGEQQQGGCSCWRWALFLIALPLMLFVSAVGIVLWVILLPIKIICCPCGCLIQMIANVVEYLVKAPLRLILWVTGKPWQPRGGEAEKKGDEHV